MGKILLYIEYQRRTSKGYSSVIKSRMRWARYVVQMSNNYIHKICHTVWEELLHRHILESKMT
jgi:hypothetical protein